MKNRKWIGLLLIIFSMDVSSQQIVKGFEIPELLKIAEVYRNSPNLSFNINYTYVDSAYPANIIEQYGGSYKIKEGKYWSMLDSMEYIQGNQFNVTVFHKDSIIAVMDRTVYGSLFQISVLDSVFRAGNVNDINVVELNDSTRSFLVRFNSDAYYNKYEIKYNLNNYRINSVEYHIKDYTDSVNTSGVGIITMTFSNYSESAIDPEIFNEGKFIYREGSLIWARSLYTTFKLIVNVEGAEGATPN